MEIKTVATNNAPKAIGPYSQAKVFGSLVFTSGQIPINPKTNTIQGDSIEEQTEQVMKNIEQVLLASGSSFEQAIKTTCFLADINDFTAFNAIYAKYFTTNPARSCVAVKDLPKGVKVEVEVIASI